jgi:hypothetical protein
MREWRGAANFGWMTRHASGRHLCKNETATTGPRIVHIDAVLECVGQSDIANARQQMLLEVSAFLSVITRTAVRLQDYGRVWVFTSDMTGCEVRSLGHLEPANPTNMPSRGTVHQVPLYPLDNPPRGIDGSTNEITIREDIADLWALYRSLGVRQRAQFLQAAAKWQEANIHWQDRPSLSFTLMVIACEALKPPDADDRQNCYDVIEALLGRTAVDRVRQNPFPAQRVRSTHLHTGEFHGSELIMTDFLASYRDPSFREVHREMFQVTSAAIVEWLKRRGTFQMPTRNNRRTLLRRLKDNVVVALVVIFGFGLAIGWVLRVFSSD